MAIELALSIIKPDAVAKNVIGKIYSRFESNGLKIVASKMVWLSTSAPGNANSRERARSQYHCKRDEKRLSTGRPRIATSHGSGGQGRRCRMKASMHPIH